MTSRSRFAFSAVSARTTGAGVFELSGPAQRTTVPSEYVCRTRSR
jgi:hypothetical protein